MLQQIEHLGKMNRDCFKPKVLAHVQVTFKSDSIAYKEIERSELMMLTGIFPSRIWQPVTNMQGDIYFKNVSPSVHSVIY